MTFLEKQKAIRLVQEIHPDLLLHLSEEDLEEIVKMHESGVNVKEELLAGFGSATLRMTGAEEEIKAKEKEEAKAEKEEAKKEKKEEVVEEKTAE